MRQNRRCDVKGSEMVLKGTNLFRKLLQDRAVKRGAGATQQHEHAERASLKAQRARAQELRAQAIDGTQNENAPSRDARFAAIPQDKNPLWVWRPQIWDKPLAQTGFSNVQSGTRIGEKTAVFHDSDHSDILLRQIKSNQENQPAPFSAKIEISAFNGSFLSLVLDLPDHALDGLKIRHIIRMSTDIETEYQVKIFARLNIEHGPNIEHIVQELPQADGGRAAEFDLAYTDANENRIKKIWLDLIFENPDVNCLMVNDLTMCRYARAEL